MASSPGEGTGTCTTEGVYSLGGMTGPSASCGSDAGSGTDRSGGGVQPTNPKQYRPGPQSSSLAEGHGASHVSKAVCQLVPQYRESGLASWSALFLLA